MTVAYTDYLRWAEQHRTTQRLRIEEIRERQRYITTLVRKVREPRRLVVKQEFDTVTNYNDRDHVISVGDDRLLTRLRMEFGTPRNEVYPGSVKA